MGGAIGSLGQREKKEKQQPMDSNLDNHVNLVIGLFAVGCLASAFFYPFSIVVGVVGLFAIAALLRAFRGGS